MPVLPEHFVSFWLPYAGFAAAPNPDNMETLILAPVFDTPEKGSLGANGLEATTGLEASLELGAMEDRKPNLDPEATEDMKPNLDPGAMEDMKPDLDLWAMEDMKPDLDPGAMKPDLDPGAMEDMKPDLDPWAMEDMKPDLDPEAMEGLLPNLDPGCDVDSGAMKD